MAKNTGRGSRLSAHYEAEARRKAAAGEPYSTWEHQWSRGGVFKQTREDAQLNGGWIEVPAPAPVRWWQFWRRGW